MLSPTNPNYYAGTAAAGLGSNHTGPGMVWPLGLVMQGMTADDDAEVVDVLQVRPDCTQRATTAHYRDMFVYLPQTLLNTTAGTGLMHESFNASQPAQYTRAQVRTLSVHRVPESTARGTGRTCWLTVACMCVTSRDSSAGRTRSLPSSSKPRFCQACSWDATRHSLRGPMSEGTNATITREDRLRVHTSSTAPLPARVYA